MIENWRELLNETSEGIYTTVYYALYLKGVISKEEYKKLAGKGNPREFGEYMDKLTDVLS